MSSDTNYRRWKRECRPPDGWESGKKPKKRKKLPKLRKWSCNGGTFVFPPKRLQSDPAASVPLPCETIEEPTH